VEVSALMGAVAMDIAQKMKKRWWHNYLKMYNLIVTDTSFSLLHLHYKDLRSLMTSQLLYE
jgi:hypothetical protein